MKLFRHLANFSSLALLFSPLMATASPLPSSPQAADNNNYNTILAPLPALPSIRFVPPTIQNNPANIPVNPGNNGEMRLGREMSTLNSQIKALMSRYNYLSPGMFFVDLQTGDYIDINGNKAFPAASTIKLPILITLFQEIEAGRVRPDETLVMRRDLVAGGSGDMQNMRVGSKFSVLQTATKMMTISDNTATNMIIDRLGGFYRLNERFRTLGLQNTALRHLLADEYGTNTTSAKDLVLLSNLIANNQILSDASRNQILDIMRRCHNQSMLPSGLGAGAVIAHKTGTLRFVLGDAGIIQTASGKRYLAGILVRRPNHDARATTFIRQVSHIVYDYINHPQQFTSVNPKDKV
ncbi:beta-lactamase [Calothrix sp. NIES-4071]|nr:beta-lactamase [Calothrix sp. NIES-4071]BAZ58164.1 beta-lactamase [Calothrix sp. NIES-4105]